MAPGHIGNGEGWNLDRMRLILTFITKQNECGHYLPDGSYSDCGVVPLRFRDYLIVVKGQNDGRRRTGRVQSEPHDNPALDEG
jgi:hypothetical protein